MLSLAAVLSSLPLFPIRAQGMVVCPQGSERVATLDPRRPWVCAQTYKRNRRVGDCPAGTTRVTTRDPLDPFRCALDGVEPRLPVGVCPEGTQAVPSKDPAKPFDCIPEKSGFTGLNTSPRCPRGYHPVATPQQLRSFRCEPGLAPSPEPPPLSLLQAIPAKPGPQTPVLKPSGYARYRVPGEVSFDYPRDWKVNDHWQDDPPAVLVQYDTGRPGKPVILAVTLYRHGSGTEKKMEAMISKEKEYHRAKETGAGEVSGMPARLLEVPKEGRTAFLRSPDGFLVLSFSAPGDLYASFVPVYERLLKSFHLVRKKSDRP